MATLTGNSPRREQRLQELILGRMLQRWERRLAREIGRAMRAGAGQVRGGGSPGYILSEHEQRLRALLVDLWTTAGKAGADRIIEAAAGRKGSRGPRRLKSAAWLLRMREWIQFEGLGKIKQIGETTLRDVRAVVDRGVAAGLGTAEIARAIGAAAPIKGASRAATIARTETHGAANFASRESAVDLALDLRRQWVSSRQEGRTRESHWDADGQVVGLHEPFIIGGVPIMYPGDQSASAPSETINCLCAVIYLTD